MTRSFAWGALATFMAVPVVAASCAEVTVDAPSAQSFCLEWADGGTVVVDELPTSLPCQLASTASRPDAGLVPAAGDHDLAYVCVAEVDGTCPAGSAIEPSLSACAGWENGEACPSNQPDDGTFVTGCCETGSVRAFCGPDPSAQGGCCYFVVVVKSSFCS